MKALVLSGGTGTRLRPLTNTTTKQLLLVGNRPILFYIMNIIKEARIKSTGVVVSPMWGERVREALGDGSRWETQITYIVQAKPAGLADAVRTARDFLVDSPFLMVLGDNIYKISISDYLAKFQGQKIDALPLLKAVDKPSHFGIATLTSGGRIAQVQEKPKQPASNLALAGMYLFSPVIHEAIESIKPSPRGELEMTDAIQKLIDMKREVRGYIFDGWWLDTGSKDDLLQANRSVLEEFMRPDIRGQINFGSEIKGKVEIMEEAVIENSLISGPVSIAANCLIKNSSIGPFASIGPQTIIEECTIENSVIQGNCRLSKIHHLTSSFIGERVEMMAGSADKAVKVFLGDSSILSF